MNLILRNTDNYGIYWFLDWLSEYDLQLLRSLIIEEYDVWYNGVVEGYTQLPGNGAPTFNIKCKIYQTKYPTEIPLHKGRSFGILEKDEAYVFILGHEFYHFLRQTRQIYGKQKEEYADEFGKKMVQKFRCST